MIRAPFPNALVFLFAIILLLVGMTTALIMLLNILWRAQG